MNVSLPDPYSAPTDRSLAPLEQEFDTLCSPLYWLKICPHLHISEGLFAQPSGPQPGHDQTESLRQRINRDGYFTLPPNELHGGLSQEQYQDLIASLAKGICLLLKHGWPTWFIAMYDETWLLAQHLSRITHAVSHVPTINMDIMAWYIDPRKDGAGFGPHRDRLPARPRDLFREDGTSLSVTCWVALTEAVPDNGCLYVIPKLYDYAYLDGDNLESKEDPLVEIIKRSPIGFQAVRALPLEAGGCAVFTHRIVHWGSASRADYLTPRISLAFGCSDDACERPFFSTANLPFPALSLRLALNAGQAIAYGRRFTLSKHMLSFYYRLFLREGTQFNSEYKAKIVSAYNTLRIALAFSGRVETKLPATKAPVLQKIDRKEMTESENLGDITSDDLEFTIVEEGNTAENDPGKCCRYFTNQY
jgi:ectoine hydroxylase-related dioxygenase (phytanoyl-CoA dioxygenase family)